MPMDRQYVNIERNIYFLARPADGNNLAPALQGQVQCIARNSRGLALLRRLLTATKATLNCFCN